MSELSEVAKKMWALKRYLESVEAFAKLSSTDDLVAQFNFSSKRTLNRVFRKATGSSPIEYMRRRRHDAATSRLLLGETVAQAAAHCGYQSTDAFSKAFSKRQGVTPSIYSKEARDMPRLEVAKRLLIRTSRSTHQVAKDAGFNSYGVFRKALKVSTGLTPSEFRQHMRQTLKTDLDCYF